MASDGVAPPPATLAQVPPEDDMDDLDDLLDDFHKPMLPPKPTAPDPAKKEPKVGGKEDGDGSPESGALSQELEAGMAELLSGLDDSPEFAKEFSKLMQDLNQQPSLAPETVSQGKAKSAPKSKDQLAADFQTTIEQTLERMEQSKQETQEAPDEDILAQMLKAMTSGGTLPDAGGDDDFSQVLLNVMEQLTNKEILYEPMKEIHDGYPAWLTKHEATEKPEDLKRYLEQQRIVGEIVQRFERNEYSDESAADREYIVERMQQMQAAGSPPADLVGEMGEAKNVLDSMESACPQQ